MKHESFVTLLRIASICLAGMLYVADAANHPADTNNDNTITQAEIEGFIGCWRKGEVGIAATVRGLTIREAGGKYRFDDEMEEPMCWIPDTSEPIGEGGINRALLVGLNNYQSPGNELRGCINDITGIQNYLLLPDEAWQENNITTLFDEQATLTNVRSKLQELARVSQTGDTVIFAQSGHGGRNQGTSCFICEYDDYYEDYQLAEDLALFRTDVRIVLIIDTCHSGGMFKGNTKSSSLLFAESVMQHYYDIKAKNIRGDAREAYTNNIAFMTASDYDESSWDTFELFGLSHGDYIGHILKASFYSSADSNNDGRFQLLELHQYASDNIPLRQHPQCLNEELLNSISVKGNVDNAISKGRGSPAVTQTINDHDIKVDISLADSIGVWGVEMTLPEGVSPCSLTEVSNANWDEDSNRLTWWGKGNATLAVKVRGNGVQSDLHTRANGDGVDISVEGDLTLVLPNEEEAQTLRYHSADYNRDGKISMDELLSVIRLYLYESNHVRTGEYHIDHSTADGFAPGPGAFEAN